MKESELRDLIAGDIGRLKPGLTLLRKEQYIPGGHGTKGFIDLYAKDERERHVLIELKRSNAAARQAIHEVHKYVEQVKWHFGAKNSEIHVIIASTEWDELLVPFSRLCGDAGFSVEGLRITVTEDGGGFAAEPVTPLPIVEGRFIAPWHHVYWYKDGASFLSGIASIQDFYRRKGIDDYIIALFYRPDSSTPEERLAAFRARVASLVGVEASELAGSLPEAEIPVYEYIAYAALQMLSREKCMEIISRDESLLEEVRETLPSMEEDEALCCLHENVEAVEPVPPCDYYEIGYPAKFGAFYEMDGCTPFGILRHGVFSRNDVLSDGVLYAELQGEDGSTGQKLKRTVAMGNTAYVKNLKEDIAAALESNRVWRNHLLRIIEEIEEEFPASEIEISVFNPCTGIFTMYYALTRKAGFLFLPSYRVLVKNPEETRLYFGALEAGGPAMTFPRLLGKYYDGDLAGLLVAVAWGGRDERDGDIIEDLGARYRSYRVDLSDGEAEAFFSLRDERWRPWEAVSPIGLFQDYAEKNRPLMEQIVSEIGYCDKGGIFDFRDGEARLEEYVDMDTAEKRRMYYAGAPAACGLCGRSLSGRKFMVDGKVRGSCGWANMCGDCFRTHGVGIGWGYGQLYQRDENGWLEVGGFCPEED